MTKQLFASHTAGWMVLSALLVSSGHLAGCDTSAPSQRTSPPETEHDQKTSEHNDQDAAAKPVTVKAPSPEDQKKSADKIAAGVDEEPAAPEVTSDAAPLVKRLVIASEIKEREPVELLNAKIEEPVLAFVELKNSEDTESGIVVTFEHEGGQEVGFVELNVPAKSTRYRTWARTRNIKKPGEWTAVVKSKTGEELARKTFQVAG